MRDRGVRRRGGTTRRQVAHTAEWCCMYTLTSRAHGTQLAVGIALTHRHSNVAALEAQNTRAPRPNQQHQRNALWADASIVAMAVMLLLAPWPEVWRPIGSQGAAKKVTARGERVSAMSYQSSQMQACVWLQQSGLALATAKHLRK